MSVPAVKPVSAPVTIPSRCFRLSDERTSAALNWSFMAGDLRCRMTEAGPQDHVRKRGTRTPSALGPSSKPRSAGLNPETRPRLPTGGSGILGWRKFHRFSQFHLLLPLRFRAAFKPKAGAPLPRIWWDGPGAPGRIRARSPADSGAPGLVTIITGSRGIGKTVMLSAAESITRQHRRAAISRADNPGIPGEGRR
jgi:hypothetical protein